MENKENNQTEKEILKAINDVKDTIKNNEDLQKDILLKQNELIKSIVA